VFTQHQHLGQPERQAEGVDMPLPHAPVVLTGRGRLGTNSQHQYSSTSGKPVDRGFKKLDHWQVNSPFAAEVLFV